MKTRQLVSGLILAGIAAVSFTAHASAPVWKVTKGKHTIYLGGTVHLLEKKDYPLPTAFEIAYQKSDILVFETDMEAINTPEFQQMMMAKMMYQDGRTIKSELSSATFSLLKKHLAERGVPMQNMQAFKPAMMSIMLTMIELQRLGMTNEGVDAFYAAKGKKDKKPVLKLETLEQQLQFMANLGKGQEDDMIKLSIQDATKIPTIMADLKKAWREGDNPKLAEVALASWQQDFPAMFNDLIVKRNNNWMPQLESYFTTPEVEFVLVGALHLVEKAGVLQQLQDKGYQVQQLD
ncbi:TraB/GumN family protein [Saccharobesus litoralis]|uniref:TraB/GumN family protein n=1 Tax=Saccharobesus litoralis TaxID=2172099 RepID=A0A2S0VV44_9ALTE|nr:TraB/GumN family protein [Saccharobesus litoralis]AWB67970.1 TraB/GumN family protein [Saccharobesus litoralis]